MLNSCTFLFVIVVAGFSTLYHKLSQVPSVPELKDVWWGKGTKKLEEVAVFPFSISTASEVIERLHQRLLSSIENLTPPMEHTSFEYGFNSETMAKVIDFWINVYNWTAQEEYLNSFPQFTTYVSGLRIHFVHVKPQSRKDEDCKALPILLLHGWLGSIREMYELIPLLTAPQRIGSTDYAFEVVIPSLPGYGFSEGTQRQGLTTDHVGLIMKKLMERLSLPRFYVHGSGIGSIIASEMALLFPESVAGMHSNLCQSTSPVNIIKTMIGSRTAPFLFGDSHSAAKIYPLSRFIPFVLQESGLLHLQATKPDTIGIALRDSPVGLAAFILEKFSAWTRPCRISAPDGGLNLGKEAVRTIDGGNLIPLNTLLDIIMIYHITGSITTSMRLFAENLSYTHVEKQYESIPITAVPVSCIRFPDEPFLTPEFTLRSRFPLLVRVNYAPSHGGHFPALEEPAVLARDIVESIHLMEGAKAEGIGS